MNSLDILDKTKKLINNNKNIVICGPKTNLIKYNNELLKLNNYSVYNGVDNFILFNKLNGITYNHNKFWIEETDISKLNNLIEDYEFIKIYENLQTILE